jgi:hypothetical protein
MTHPPIIYPRSNRSLAIGQLPFGSKRPSAQRYLAIRLMLQMTPMYWRDYWSADAALSSVNEESGGFGASLWSRFPRRETATNRIVVHTYEPIN